MKNRILIVITILISISVFGQEKRKIYFPAWTYHNQNSDIYGVSLGVLPKDVFNDYSETRTYGLRIEAPGFGLFYMLAPSSYISGGSGGFITDKVYGFNLSGGSLGDIEVNGLSGALVGQYLQRVNGIAIAYIGNSIE